MGSTRWSPLSYREGSDGKARKVGPSGLDRGERGCQRLAQHPGSLWRQLPPQLLPCHRWGLCVAHILSSVALAEMPGWGRQKSGRTWRLKSF